MARRKKTPVVSNEGTAETSEETIQSTAAEGDPRMEAAYAAPAEPDSEMPTPNEVYESSPALEQGSNSMPDDRTAERRVFRIKTIVQFKESDEESWKEVIEVATVSKQGAGLTLSRPVPVGRIISLVMQMPRELRLYDHFAPVYPVLGIVQNCTEAAEDGQPVFHVGVAFFGKRLPEGFKANPQQCYRISGLKDGLWSIVEAANTFQARRHSRFWRRFEVTVSRRDQNKKAIQREHVFTRDVSSGGMSLWGPLEASVGDRLKITCKEPEFFAVATVKNRTDHRTDETRSMIHLQFDTDSFPVEKVHIQTEQPQPEDAPADLAEVFGEVTVQ